MKKKILSWVLSIAMIISALPVQSFAQEIEIEPSAEIIEEETSTTESSESESSSEVSELEMNSEVSESETNLEVSEPLSSAELLEPEVSADIVEPQISYEMAQPQISYASAETRVGDFTVVGGTLGEDYIYSNHTLTIITENFFNNLVISGTTTQDKIVVAENVMAMITFAGLDIQFSDGNYHESGKGTCAFEVLGKVSITLETNTVNTLKSGAMNAGIQLQSNANAQIQGSGTLNVTGGGKGAGIGGGYNEKGGAVWIMGGTVNANGGYGGAGIGGGFYADGGNITIGGGTVKANGGAEAAGIGGGSYKSGGTIEINYGTVDAVGGYNASGIGGGVSGDGGNITITGGKVTATNGAGGGGAGIGGGSGGEGGNITIGGGEVLSKGGYNAAGIGAGSGGKGENITISGGEIIANGGYNGAAIGGSNRNSGGIITISGGKVTANGNGEGAGIGGGKDGEGGIITITSGEVTANGGDEDNGGGAGIGGGDNATGGTIKISGGLVIANGGFFSSGIGNGSGKAYYISTEFSTGENGTAIIKASGGMLGISDETNISNWKGIIMSNDNYYKKREMIVYGDQTVSYDFAVDEGETLIVNSGVTLTVPSGKTITNNNGEILVNGTLTGDGTLDGDGVFRTDTFTEEDIVDIPDQNYTGEQITPNVEVNREIMRRIFTANINSWTKTYENNIKVGTATFRLKKGDTTYSKTFKILQYTGDFTVTGGVQGEDFNYNNKILTILTSTALDIKNTDPNTATKDKIVVDSGVEANITLGGVNIDVSAEEDACAFKVLGEVNINLKEGTENTLKSGFHIAGLQVQSGAEIWINGSGALNATGGMFAAGIGGSSDDAGNITISGGEVTACGNKAAGIGGGYASSGGNIIITGGTITATYINGGSGIGGGKDSNNSGTFITGENGTAIIKASSIQDQSQKANWKGIIFENGTGAVYGEQTLSNDLTIESGQTLTINPETSLTIPSGKTLTNSGTLTNNGTLTGEGILSGEGSFLTDVFTADDISNIENQEYTGAPIEPNVVINCCFIGVEFTLNTDGWEKTYEKNKEVGTAKVVFTKGDVKVEKTFQIVRNREDLTVTGGDKGSDYSYENGILTILKDTALTITGTTTKDEIVVAEGITANITLAGVNVDVSERSNHCAFEVLGKVNITLADGTENTLKSGTNKAGLHVETGKTVTINGETNGTGILNATGGFTGSGIGGGREVKGGDITINGGTIIATSNWAGAGIGSGYKGEVGNIKITGGTITATGGILSTNASVVNASGIGSGFEGNGGDITITGGTVTATGVDSNASGIGGIEANITISGGTVTATGVRGNGIDGKESVFTTGEDGTAIIKASSIQDQSHKDEWKGIIFEDGKGAVYGNQTLSQDLTIEEDETLTINPDSNLTIDSDKTLTNQGTLTNCGTLEGTSTLQGDGIFEILTADCITDIPDQDYTGEEITPLTTLKFTEKPIMGKIFTVSTNGWTKSYESNTDIGTAKVIFTKGDVVIAKTFNIISNEIISIDITWGSMSYSYSDGDWNTQTHEYENGAWVCEDGSNEITVENNGSNSENISFVYNSDDSFSNIVGIFTDESENAITTAIVDVDSIKKFYLALKGKPTEEFSEQTIGNVTITIGGNQ